MNHAKRILFLDGIGCNPEGYKPTYLRGLGYEVAAPMLPDTDFARAVATAEEAFRTFLPDVVIGYSRGAGVALSLANNDVPRLLIASSLRWVADGRQFPGRVIALHSATDDGLPLSTVQDHLRRCGIAVEALRVVGDDHTMIDPPALAALAGAVDELIQCKLAG